MASALETVYLTARKDAIFPNIVCVHGLGAQPESTWHHEDTGKTWIKDADFLELLDGSCRVFAYEYNAAITANLSAAGILFHAHDLLACLELAIRNGNIGPVFFVAHSWGGIIVKKAIHLAWTQPRFKPIQDCLAGVFFLGTPHVYHDMRIVMDAVRNTVALHREEDDDIPESEIRLYAMGVRQVNETFYKCRPSSVYVGSFWESQPTPIRPDIQATIISVDCRVADMDEELDSTVDCNHVDLARFPTPVDSRFRCLILALNRAIVNTMGKEDLPIFSNIPTPPAPEDPDKQSPSPVQTPPVDGPTERPPPPKPLFDPRDGADERIVYWKRKTKEEETYKQRTNFLRSLKGWSEYNTGSHLAVTPGTCSWVFDDPAVTFWRTDVDCGTMFITGEAGCGKSHLAKDMADRLKASHSTNTVMNFHCNPGERPFVWEYFTWYLISHDHSWFDEVPAQYRDRDVDSPPLSNVAFVEIWNSFRALASLRSIYMIVDGLEHCGDAIFEEFFKSVQQMRLPVVMSANSLARVRGDKRPLPTQIKVAFTSRSTSATDIARSRLTYTSIPSEFVAVDIARYVESRWAPLVSERDGKLNKKALETCKEDALNHAKGYWIYAKFALEEVEQAALQDKYIKLDSGDHMPSSLRAYLTEKLRSKLREPGLNRLAQTILTFIACAPVATYFPVAVLKDLLRLFSHKELERDDTIAAFKREWGDFISFTSNKKQTAGFIHESVAHVMRGFLTEQQRHLNNAFVCLNYLLLGDFVEPPDLQYMTSHNCEASIERFLETFPFYDGAASLVISTIRSSGKLALQLEPLLRVFFDQECPQYRTWCMWKDWKHNKIQGSTVSDPVVVHFVSCIEILKHFLPPSDPLLGRWPTISRLVANLFNEAQHKDSFLEADDWPETRNSLGQTPLMMAILSGKSEVIKFILEYEPDVNTRAISGLTPLMACLMSAKFNQTELSLDLIDLLVHRGADINAFETSTGSTPLCHAASLGDPEAVRFLISRGANVHSSDTRGESPLERAFVSGQLAAFVELARYGASVDAWWSRGETPLSMCILEEELDMLEFLLPLCDVNLRDARGMTPLNNACSTRGRNEYIRMLLDHPRVNIDILEQPPGSRAGGGPINALTRTVYKRNYQAAEMLLNAGADPGRLPGMDTSPLFVAVATKSIDIVKLLLDFNAPLNVYVPTAWPCTALAVAVDNKDEELVALLLEHGADPTIEDAYEETGPLAIAVVDIDPPNLPMVQMLLSARIPANVNSLYRKCPIIVEACENGNSDLVRLLLDHGADLSAWLVPHAMPSPLVMAAEKGHVEVCELLLEIEPGLLNVQFKELANCDTPLLAAAEAGQTDVVRFLLERGARADLLSPVWKKSALHGVCRNGDYKCAKVLLDKAPEMANVPDARDCMPWTEACGRGDLKIMKALLDAGADYTWKDRRGNSYIEADLFVDSATPEKTIELLLEYGMDINAPQDAEGNTILGFAILDGKARHVRWLLEHGADPLRCRKSRWREDTWRNALMLGMNSDDSDVLELLLEPRWGLLEHLTDADEWGMNVLCHGSHHAQMFSALEDEGKRRGENLVDLLISQRDINGRTAVDIALGDLTIRPSAYPAVTALLVEYIEKVLSLPGYNHNEHQYLVLNIGYDLLHLGGHDEAAKALLAFVITVPKYLKKDEGEHQDWMARRLCVVCDGTIHDLVLVCRFCWRLRCQDCDPDVERRGDHVCETVEVPVGKDQEFMLEETLRDVLADLQAAGTTPQSAEVSTTGTSPEEANIQSTLQLATLHAFNFLAIRRPLFTPYLELAPSVEKLIAPWKDMISEQRQYWETDNMIYETHWKRRWEEMRYLNRCLGMAYANEGDVARDLILRDMRRIFEVNSGEYDEERASEISF